MFSFPLLHFFGEKERVATQESSLWDHVFFPLAFFLGKKNELQHKNHHYGIMFSFPLLHCSVTTIAM
jgi:hypothetical protein